MKTLYLTTIFFFVCFCSTGCSKDNSLVLTTNGQAAFSSESDISDDMGHAMGTQSGADSDKSSDGTQNEVLYVYVCGHVANPGVYQLHIGDRICNALEQAGGVCEDGMPEALEQAAMVSDGQTIYVPGIGEDNADTVDIVDDGLLNINNATKEELILLPGIGGSKADDIIAYREQHGGFSTIEEIMNIPGIKEGVFNKIKDRIKV